MEVEFDIIKGTFLLWRSHPDDYWYSLIFHDRLIECGCIPAVFRYASTDYIKYTNRFRSTYGGNNYPERQMYVIKINEFDGKLWGYPLGETHNNRPIPLEHNDIYGPIRTLLGDEYEL